MTACPQEDDVRRFPPLEAIADVQPGCEGAIVHEDATIRFGTGTDLRSSGTHAVSRWPQATMARLGGPPAAFLPSDDGLGLASDDGAFRFGPASLTASVQVTEGRDVAYYNGTSHVFLLEADEATWVADGVAGAFRLAGPVLLQPAESALPSYAHGPALGKTLTAVRASAPSSCGPRA